MDTQSEKLLYKREVEEVLRKLDVDCILWGEDLFDARIVVYPNRISEIAGYSRIKNSLLDVALVFFDFSRPQFIQSSVVACDWDDEVLYIAEEKFNDVWPYLRKSVELGIRIQHKRGNKPAAHCADGIVDLYLLQRKSNVAVIKDGLLTYIPKEISEDKKKAQSRKQSALDNPKNLFFYEKMGHVYHDRDCVLVHRLPAEDFLFSEDRPEGYNPCIKCRRKMLLREACSPYLKSIPLVDQMMFSENIKDNYLEKCVREYALKLHAEKENELIVEGGEDTWIIKGFENKHYTLWHNNYVKTDPKERYITHGFHKQKKQSTKLYSILEYINNYTYEKHLAAQEQATEQSICVELEPENTTGFFARVMAYFRDFEYNKEH